MTWERGGEGGWGGWSEGLGEWLIGGVGGGGGEGKVVAMVLGEMCEVDCGQKDTRQQNRVRRRRKKASGGGQRKKQKMGKEYKLRGKLTRRVEKNKRTRVQRKAQRERPT